MSTPSPNTFDPRAGLMLRIAAELSTLFDRPTIDPGMSRKMVMSAISSYKPEGRADFINIARTVAFSTASINLLGDLAASRASVPEKMRIHSRAIALSRCADQSERTMLVRRG